MKIFFRLIRFTLPYVSRIVLSILLGVATISSAIGLLGTSAYLISQAALHPSIAVLQVAIVGVRFFGISRGVFRYLERLVSHSVNFRILASLRSWFFEALEPLAPARLLEFQSGDLLNRSVSDIDELENFYIRVIAPPSVAVIVLIGVGILMGHYHIQLAGILVGSLVFLGAILPVIIQRLSRQPEKLRIDTQAKMNTTLVEGIQGMSDLIVFCQREAYEKDFNVLNLGLRRAQLGSGWIKGLSNALNSMVSNFAVWAILFLAVPMVSTGGLYGVDLAVISLITLASFEAVASLGVTAQYLESSLHAARRLFAVVDTQPVISAPQVPLRIPADMTLNIQNLSFQYSKLLPYALRNIDLYLGSGKRIAIVGPNGAGKSTLIHLLMRYWEYGSGIIEVGGNDIKDYHPRELRTKFGVISQSTHIFSGTIRSNLLLAFPDASERELWKVLRQVFLEEYVNKLPEGIDTWVGEEGQKMSGGERQRLVVARALLKKAPIMLVDEATSHLDPMAEEKILRTILDVTTAFSTIWITHRLKFMDKMDEIVVLREGEIIERGKHEILLNKQGYYSRMWNLQNSYF
jgi:ATP-binding cassette, subfamily C, bacterial CydC